MRRAGGTLLARLRRKRVHTHLTKAQQEQLLDALGTSIENVDELLSIETEEE